MTREDFAVYNPHGKPLEELPKIYGFNNGGWPGFMYAQLISEDGVPLGSHICSSEGYMYYDLGIVEGYREDRHADFRKRYPDGYRMDFVTGEEAETHEGLKAAIKIAMENAPDD